VFQSFSGLLEYSYSSYHHLLNLLVVEENREKLGNWVKTALHRLPENPHSHLAVCSRTDIASSRDSSNHHFEGSLDA
jgi:hypothetical protein